MGKPAEQYVVLTTTGLFTHVQESDFTKHVNKMLEQGYIPLGGCIHYGTHGLMQTMYLPKSPYRIA